jgi:hypothetical protein
MRNGYRVLDTDAHQMEPPTMWADYCDPAFADRAPRIGDLGGGRKGMLVEGEPVEFYPKSPFSCKTYYM